MPTGLTLSEQFFRDQAQSGASGDLSTVLNRVSLAARMLAAEIIRAGFVGKLGLTGSTNVQDEQVRELDVISNDIVSQVMDHAPMIAGIGSEEMEDVFTMPGSEHGKYVLTIDPLDGSGNVDVDGAMGTIFGIYRRPKGRAGQPADVSDFLQPGRDLVAAGYVLYGPSTMFVYSVGGSVNGFTLDRSIGTFFLTHADIRIPEGSGSYAVNEANEVGWDTSTQRMVAEFRRQKTECGPRRRGTPARSSPTFIASFSRAASFCTRPRRRGPMGSCACCTRTHRLRSSSSMPAVPPPTVIGRSSTSSRRRCINARRSTSAARATWRRSIDSSARLLLSERSAHARRARSATGHVSTTAVRWRGRRRRAGRGASPTRPTAPRRRCRPRCRSRSRCRR